MITQNKTRITPTARTIPVSNIAMRSQHTRDLLQWCMFRDSFLFLIIFIPASIFILIGCVLRDDTYRMIGFVVLFTDILTVALLALSYNCYREDLQPSMTSSQQQSNETLLRPQSSQSQHACNHRVDCYGIGIQQQDISQSRFQ